jgi:hypothetical protein
VVARGRVHAFCVTRRRRNNQRGALSPFRASLIIISG